jgi:hypothetical protein
MSVGSVFGGIHDVFADVTDSHVLHVTAPEKRTLIARAHIPQPDASHHDPIAGWGPVRVAQRL